MKPTATGSSSNAFPHGSATAFPIAKQIPKPAKPKRKTISQRDKEMWEQSFLSFPTSYPLLHVVVERCPRVCNCIGCSRPIKCGDQRLHFYLKVSPKPNLKGGVIQRRSMFLHPACFFGRCEARTDDAVVWGWGVSRCFDCHKDMPEEDYGCYFASPGIGSAALCLSCASQKRWRKCHSCLMFFNPSKVLRAPDDNSGQASPGDTRLDRTPRMTWLCKLCKQQFNFPSYDDAERAQAEVVDELEFFEAFKTAIEDGEPAPPMPKHMIRKMRMSDRAYTDTLF